MMSTGIAREGHRAGEHPNRCYGGRSLTGVVDPLSPIIAAWALSMPARSAVMSVFAAVLPVGGLLQRACADASLFWRAGPVGSR
jgi:hypothetical protein